MRLLHIATAMTSVGLLAACGGSPSDSPAPAPAPGTPASITLTGVVAKGAALASAVVTTKCATGTGTATSSSTGGYTITITGGVLPCVLEATSSDAATVLHSVATATAGSTAATANITTLTELLVAELAGQNPTAYMAGLSTASLSTTVTTATVSTAQAGVVSTLTAAGIDTSAIGNMVSGTLVAASTGTTGNAYDLVLDNLLASLTAGGTSFSQLVDTMVLSSPNAPSGGSTGVATLPPALLLKPQASNCAALRSADYRLLKIAPSLTTGAADPVTAAVTMSFDATTLTATFGPNDTQTLTAAGNCQYTTPDGGDVVVSPSGVIVVRTFVGADDDTTSDGGKVRMLIAVPVQSIAVAELEGDWNLLDWDFESAGVQAPHADVIHVNASGAVTSSKCNADALNTAAASCTSESTPLPVFSAHAEGGFTLASNNTSDVWSSRFFAYKAGNGALMLVGLDAQGELSIGTKVQTLSLPSIGRVTTSWNIAISSATVADALSTTTNTITGANVDTGIVTRNSQNGTSTFTVPQQMAYNTPRAGLLRRTPETVTASDGSSATVREGYFLSMPALGLTAYVLPDNIAGAGNNARFGMSVNQPQVTAP